MTQHHDMSLLLFLTYLRPHSPFSSPSPPPRPKPTTPLAMILHAFPLHALSPPVRIQDLIPSHVLGGAARSRGTAEADPGPVGPDEDEGLRDGPDEQPGRREDEDEDDGLVFDAVTLEARREDVGFGCAGADGQVVGLAEGAVAGCAG